MKSSRAPRRCWFAASLLLLASSSLFGATYYVDATNGNDANAGTSTALAWKNLSRVNNGPLNNGGSYAAGDSILFERGEQWIGQLAPLGSGSNGSPIIIDAYGTGSLPLPLLKGNGTVTSTLTLFNQQYWEIRNLEITNTGATLGNGRNGIYISAQHFGKVSHIYLTDLIIHDVNGDDDTFNDTTGGVYIQITGEPTDPGAVATWYDDLKIDGCYVYNCSERGITGPYSAWADRTLTTSTTWTPSTNVVITNCLFEHCRRQGLVWRVAAAPLIEHNIFANCSDGGHGNAMFVFNTDDALIQKNEAYGTRFETGNPEPGQDAAGFDVDYRTKRTIVQYNYSHDNGEGGIIATGGPTTDPGNESFCDATVIRYNILQNNHRAAFRFSGRITNTHVYNNTIYISSTLSEPVDRIIELGDWSSQWPDHTNFYNNIFANYSSNADYSLGAGATNTVFDYNIFYNSNSAPANQPAGSHQLSSDPLFVAGGTGGIGWDTVDGYKLQSGSPAIANKGLLISTNGGQDYYGNTVSTSTASNRGAYEGAGLSQVAAPTFSPIGGMFASGQTVTISTTTTGASIYYTLDGTTPSPLQGTLYSGAISIGSTANLQAVAIKSGLAASTVTAAPFVIPSGSTIALEAESLTVTTSGATASNLSDSSASGGTCKVMTADGTSLYAQTSPFVAGVTSQWMEFTTTSIPAGTYELGMRYKAANTRLIVEVMLDGVQIGTTVDQYSASATYPTAKLGRVSFPASGTHKLRLVITGQNAASSGFTLSADCFTFTAPGALDIEPELFTPTVSGAVATNGIDVSASSFGWVSFAANGVNDYIQYTTYHLPAGTYDLKLRYKAYNNRGIAQVQVDGSVVGSVDMYASAVAWSTASVATVTLAASGTHTVRLTVTGKNASSSGYMLTPDLITFDTASPFFEAESLTVSGTKTISNVADAAASGGYRVVLSGTGIAAGDYIQFTTPSVPAGVYNLQFSYHKASSRGIAQVSVDGTNVGSTVDQYASPSSYQTTTIGLVTFGTAGTHTIKLAVTGKNASSTDFTLSADCFKLEPQ